MSDKKAKSGSAKKEMQLAVKTKMVELLLSLDPAMKEKKVLRRADKATKIITRGINKPKVILSSEVFEIQQ